MFQDVYNNNNLLTIWFSYKNKVPTPPSFNSLIYERAHFFSFQEFNFCKQDVSYFTVESILSVCALGASRFHITLTNPT